MFAKCMFCTCIVNQSPTAVPRPSGGACEVSLLQVDDSTRLPRLNSMHLRDLGKFIISSKEITQLETIGQGDDIYVYFVY